jgi:CRP-like cAMP-binding protein
MMRTGHITNYEQNHELKKEGENSKDLMLILDGAVELRSVGSTVAKISTSDGQFKFVGIPRKLTSSDEDDVGKKDEATHETTDNKMVQVVTASQSKMLVFNLAALRELLANEPALSNGLLQLFHERLLQKVLIRDKSLAVKRYFAMIELAIKEAEAEGEGLLPDVKRGLKKFRREHHISKLEHKEALAAVGWTR